MSHGATSTQSMAFTNNVGSASGMRSQMGMDGTLTHVQSRSFNATGNNSVTDQKSMNGSFHAAFGGRGHAWGSSSIWSNGLTNGLSSGNGTRDHSESRDSAHQSGASPTDEVEGKTGSGSLVESSVSEDYANRASWSTMRNAGPGRSGPNARYGDNTTSQQRSTSNAGLTQTLSGGNQNLMAFTSRPPTINLNPTASVQPRQSFGSALASGIPGRTTEQPPFNVYTKFDRPSDPAHRKPDSAVGGWGEPTTTPSPSEERRPPFPMPFSRTTSMPASRDGSLPPSRHTDEAPMFTRPDYSRPSQRVTPSSSRAPSISSTRNGAYNGYHNVGADYMTNQLGQLGLGSDSRPSTSYKQALGANGFGGASTPSTGKPSVHTQTSSFGRADNIDEIQRTNGDYTAVDELGRAQRFHNVGISHSGPSFAERYFESGNNYEYQPGQPYPGSTMSSSTFEVPGGLRSSEWHNFGNPTLTMGRRSPGIPENQAFMDPRVQQLMAAQLRNPYAAIYSPYALPNLLQLNASPAFPGLMALTMPSMDAPVGPRDSPVGDGVQSALMYEFKSNTKTKRYELRDIYDHIAEFSGDQHGSRFIQTKLETANSDEKERVFREIQPNAIPLMTDVFGNYVIQKFFEHGDQTHKKILANKMRGQVLQLSLQMYGCRVVQKALDHVLVDQQALLISELENHVLKCVKDQNGNHVIQKAIERCPSSTIGFIIASFQGQVQHLSIHPYGCRVIQRCLEKYDLPSRAMIMSELMEGVQTMISDQFGNYVVQHIVSHDNGEPKRRVLAIILHGLEGYSKHKFASNVVEKCLEKSDDAWRRQVVYSLAQSNQQRTEGEGVLVGLIKDNFGNYVIQKLLDTLSPDDYFQFLDMLQPAMATAKRTGCGKQTLSIDKKMHRFDSVFRNTNDAFRNNNNNSNSTQNNQQLASTNGIHMPRPSFTLQMPTPPFASNYNSAATTPPPLTADSLSLQSSGIPSVNGDAVEGAAVSRKGSEQPVLENGGFVQAQVR